MAYDFRLHKYGKVRLIRSRRHTWMGLLYWKGFFVQLITPPAGEDDPHTWVRNRAEEDVAILARYKQGKGIEPHTCYPNRWRATRDDGTRVTLPDFEQRVVQGLADRHRDDDDDIRTYPVWKRHDRRFPGLAVALTVREADRNG